MATFTESSGVARVDPAQLKLIKDAPAEVLPLFTRADSLLAELSFVMEAEDEN